MDKMEPQDCVFVLNYLKCWTFKYKNVSTISAIKQIYKQISSISTVLEIVEFKDKMFGSVSEEIWWDPTRELWTIGNYDFKSSMNIKHDIYEW